MPLARHVSKHGSGSKPDVSGETRGLGLVPSPWVFLVSNKKSRDIQTNPFGAWKRLFFVLQVPIRLLRSAMLNP
jgi:hypothetical protein